MLTILSPLVLLALAPSGAPAQAARESAVAPAPEPSFADARVILWQAGVENAYPRWSRDGERVLYQSNRTGRWQIRVMDADGANDRALGDGSANDNFPDWSPDNEWIAFVSDRGGDEDVYVMRMDGSGLANLSRHPARDIHPYWTPDGRALLFNSARDAPRLQIYEVARDGSGLRRLVESPDDDTCARVDPKGERFLYLTNLARGQDDVLVRRRDGSEPVNLTHDPATDGWPTWTPEGDVVFCSMRGGRYALYRMRADGSGALQLSFPEGRWSDARPSVSADGRRIVFNRTDGTTIGICALDLAPETPEKG